MLNKYPPETTTAGLAQAQQSYATGAQAQSPTRTVTDDLITSLFEHNDRLESVVQELTSKLIELGGSSLLPNLASEACDDKPHPESASRFQQIGYLLHRQGRWIAGLEGLVGRIREI